MSFAEIYGQKRAIALLKAGFKTKRISHAYLFYGPEGVGKFKTALTFAQLLNCAQPVGEEPCGSCNVCKKVDSGNHPDLKVIKPDGASIKIEQIRVLQEKVYFKCYEGKFKVIMIDDAHLMTPAAANSLLKVLEEPPAQTIFILLADDLNKLPVTIQSRCLPIPFAYLDEAVIGSILKEQGIKFPLSLTLAQGSIGKALEIIENGESQQLASQLQELLGLIKNGGYHELFLWTDKLNKNKQKNLGAMILEWLLVLYAQRAVALSTGKVASEQSSLAKLELGNFTEVDLKECFVIIEAINKAAVALAKNGNYRLTMDVLLLQLRNIEQRERWG